MIRGDMQYEWFVAAGFAMMEETDLALKWLRHAVEDGFLNFGFLAFHDPHLENLRGTERFKELMSEVKATSTTLRG
jgi:hypothetical protein